MKKLILLTTLILLTAGLSAQNKFTYPIEIGKVSVSNGQITLKGSTSGSVVIKPNVVAGTGTIFQLPANNGTNGQVLSTNGSGVTSWAAGESLSDIAPMLADTVPLVTFGAGAGLIADTALMNDGVLIGSFYNDGSDSLNITKLVGILKEGTGTETISVQISWHATMLSGSATSLNAAALAITSMTTGTIDTSFANAKIPPNVFVWGILSGASKDNKPTFLSVTLSGYKIPKY